MFPARHKILDDTNSASENAKKNFIMFSHKHIDSIYYILFPVLL